MRFIRSHPDQNVFLQAASSCHAGPFDPTTAAGLGMYDEAKAVMKERATVEKDLGKLPPGLPALPAAAELRRNADRAFDGLDEVLAGGTIEQRRELIGLYVQQR